MKIHLSESQVKKLISDYKTINEQSVGFNPETKTETVNFNSVWRSGYWKLASNQIQNLNNQMKVIQDFLSKNPQTKLSIHHLQILWVVWCPQLLSHPQIIILLFDMKG